MKKLTRKEIIEKLMVNNENYRNGNFEIFEYNTRTRLIRTKNKYGECLVNISNLLSGNSPTIKTAINKTEYWINMVLEKRCCDYDYSKVFYVDNSTKVDILCNKHNKYFSQTPAAHLAGQGCPYCAKENSQKVTYKKYDYSYFYVLKCFNNEEEFIKIGNTVGKLSVRYDSKRKMPYSYKVIENIFCDIDEVQNIEKRLKNKLSSLKYKPNAYFSGATTETFSIESLSIIREEIEKFKCN